MPLVGDENEDGDEREGSREERNRRLFARYLRALDEGHDLGTEILREAGDDPELAREIEQERELRRLLHGGFSGKVGDARDHGLETPDERYEILREIASGGQSVVHEAYDHKLKRRVAFKVLRPELRAHHDEHGLILREARSLARLSHPGIVRVHEVGECARGAYIAMELLEGPSLSQLIARWKELTAGLAPRTPEPPATEELARATLPIPRRVEILAKLAEALAHCHEQGILHRDVKPQNVLFHKGEPVFIDLGLAHVDDGDSASGTTQGFAGTPPYLAPEQVRDGRTGASALSDQFSFGTMAYEVLALENPFLRPRQRATEDAIEAATPPPLRKKVPELPSDLGLVVHHALELDPHARYPDLFALARELRAVLGNRPVIVTTPTLAHRGRLWLRRHRRGATVAGAVLGLTLAIWSATFCLGVRSARTALLGELDTMRPEEFTTPDQLEPEYERLVDLARRATGLERSLAGPWLAGGTSAAVDRKVDAWSRSLARLLARDLERERTAGLVLQDRIYRRLIWLDERLCPDCPYNLENRLRGRVRLPTALMRTHKSQLSRMTYLDHLILPLRQRDAAEPGHDPFNVNFLKAFQPVPPVDELIPGIYRLQLWKDDDGEVLYETVFLVSDRWEQYPPLEPRRPRDEFRPDCADLDAALYALFGPNEVRIPRYRILGHAVTQAEFSRFQDETGAASAVFHPGGDSEAPAQVSFDDAMAFARWAGGRLPTYLELCWAAKEGAIQFPVTRGLAGEFTLDSGKPLDATQPGWKPYGANYCSIVMDREHLTEAKLENSEGPVVFRLVFPNDKPSTYRAIELAPIEN